MDELIECRHNEGVLFWLLTMKRMRMGALCAVHQKLLQTVMSLAMLSLIVFVAFCYQFHAQLMDAVGKASAGEVVFSMTVNSGMAQVPNDLIFADTRLCC